jgi:glycosyltransferase involved in cell wall biosynthesis
MPRIANIAAWDNGGGLSKDIQLLVSTLNDLGWDTRHFGKPTKAAPESVLKSKIKRIARRIRRLGLIRKMLGAPFDVNFHFEDVFPAHLPHARKNVLIPNQDWFRDSSRPFLRQLDSVFAKTRYAEQIFSSAGLRTVYIGWRSSDKYDAARSEPRELSALHVAGSSSEKGTELVLDRWEKHPGWPPLTVVRSSRHYAGEALPWKSRTTSKNIRLIEERISEAALRSLQNQHLLHICPSEAEGYGHIIAEAMSAGAVVITTDGPPMNELVSRERGILIPVERSEPMGIGNRFVVAASALDAQINQVLRMSHDELAKIGANARQWFSENEALFPARLRIQLEEVVISK